MLDLCCGAGGAAMGYHRAGFHVVGVDINPQPNYPFHFIQADITKVNLAKLARQSRAEFIHASPPCQKYTTLVRGTQRLNNEKAGREHPDLITDLRPKLDEIGLPYVIENVPTAPIRKDVVLCGEMFGLGVIRHRAFEITDAVFRQPAHRPHRGRVAGWRHGTKFDGPYVAVYGHGGGKGTVPAWQEAMGIDWTDVRKELVEAIPPSYTHYLGLYALGHARVEAA